MNVLLPMKSLKELTGKRSRAINADALATARRMLEDIDRRGEVAVLEYARQLGDLPDGVQAIFSRADLKAAESRIPSDQREVLTRVAGRIRSFAEAQRGCLQDLDTKIPGGHAGHQLKPVESAGCYALADAFRWLRLR